MKRGQGVEEKEQAIKERKLMQDVEEEGRGVKEEEQCTEK